ncbi:MAG: twin-arginine translocase TatA/TatE family subunit [Alphaproteobacteria bacterium]|nr:twin-arginine translocase TatA/TatE family subunit [Alphaproteobacteria bacterium]
MGMGSIWHWIIVLVIIMLLFGKDKIPSLMGDMAKGVRAFKQGLRDDDAPASAPASTEPKALERETAVPVPSSAPTVANKDHVG